MKALTRAQILTLRRLATGTKYLLRGDGKKGEEVREGIRIKGGEWWRDTYHTAAPSLPRLYRESLIRFVSQRVGATQYGKVELTEKGQEILEKNS